MLLRHVKLWWKKTEMWFDQMRECSDTLFQVVWRVRIKISAPPREHHAAYKHNRLNLYFKKVVVKWSFCCWTHRSIQSIVKYIHPVPCPSVCVSIYVSWKYTEEQNSSTSNWHSYMNSWITQFSLKMHFYSHILIFWELCNWRYVK